MAALAGARTLPVIAALGFVLAGCSSSLPTVPLAENGSVYSNYHSYRLGTPHYTVKPYQVNGVWYYPQADYAYDATGTASWYGPGFDRRPTADGEIYDMNGLSAAHKTLPLPSVVEVTNLQNGRELTLRVNDRGPFVGDRLIDLSRRAAQLLGFERNGTAPVRVRILKDDSIRVAEAAMRGQFGETAYAEGAPAGRTELAAAPPPEPEPMRLASAVPPSLRATEVIGAPPPLEAYPASRPSRPEPAPIFARAEPAPLAIPSAAMPPTVAPPTMLAEAAPALPEAEAAPIAMEPPVQPPAVRQPPPWRMAAAAPRRRFWPSLIAEARADTLPRQIVLARRHAARPVRALPVVSRPTREGRAKLAAARHVAGIFVQAGAFAVAANAERVRARVAVLGRTEVVRARVKGASLYRVRLGPVAGEIEAHRLLGRVIARGYRDARMVDR